MRYALIGAALLLSADCGPFVSAPMADQTALQEVDLVITESVEDPLRVQCASALEAAISDSLEARELTAAEFDAKVEHCMGSPELYAVAYQD